MKKILDWINESEETQVVFIDKKTEIGLSSSPHMDDLYIVVRELEGDEKSIWLMPEQVEVLRSFLKGGNHD